MRIAKITIAAILLYVVGCTIVYKVIADHRAEMLAKVKQVERSTPQDDPYEAVVVIGHAQDEADAAAKPEDFRYSATIYGACGLAAWFAALLTVSAFRKPRPPTAV